MDVHAARAPVQAGRSASLSWTRTTRWLSATVHHVLVFRRPIIVGLHLLLMVVANYLAFWLRFDGVVPREQQALFRLALPWVVLVRAMTFVPLRLYQGIWRYTGLWELQRIVWAGVVSSAICYAVVRSWPELSAYPPSVIAIDALLLIFMTGGVRLIVRLGAQGLPTRGLRRVLIVGAGDAGETIVRSMKRRHELEPIGFVDDDPNKVGQGIHGVPVLGTRADLPSLMMRERPQEVLIAVPHADPAIIQEVVQTLRPFRVRITTLPTRHDIVNGIPATRIRDVSIEDLLARAPVDLDERLLRRLIEGRRVMVTGAGGSIGSELCRQIAALFPADLVLYERYENNLFAIEMDLADRGASAFVHPVIGDVTDAARLDAVMAEHRPEIVFHAAAHKHVPLMEHNPCESVKNNVGGTRLLAETAERHGVRRFIFISSDKAVNPTSVMGATKRIGELVLQTHREGRTSFSTVRFGNVLGSNGSVVPRFLQQIRAGGPVTITHPEIRRYFMLIPEAVHLVLHAAAQKTPGMVYVLEMGDQIKLVDLARNLITLSGFVPDEEIKITFVGLRPGEKLFEELVGPDEQVRSSPTEKILEVSPRTLPDPDQLTREISKLEQFARWGDEAAVLKQIGAIVTEFNAPATEAPRPVPASEPPRAQVRFLTDEATRGLDRCSVCGSARRSRSRTRSLPASIGSPLTSHRPYICAECERRGMAASRKPVAPDFRSVDLVLRARSSAARRPFFPQDLR